MELGRHLGKVGVRVCGFLLPPLVEWVEGHIPREALAAYQDTAHRAKLCCAVSEPGRQQGLFTNRDSSGSLFYTCQHKTSRNECLCPPKTCIRAFTATYS